jgi:hypothetical protein
MIHRIHILGASGSGTTTLGCALAERLQCPHFDADDYFWLPTDPPFTHQRERTQRQRLLMDDLTAHDSWVVSGSLCGWGDVAIPLFELVVFLAIDPPGHQNGTSPSSRACTVWGTHSPWWGHVVVYLLVAGNIQASPPSSLRRLNQPVRSLRKGFSRPWSTRVTGSQAHLSCLASRVSS